MGMSLKGKVIVVSGGAGLLGREFVKTILENNGICIIADNNEKIGRKLLSSFEQAGYGKRIDYVKIDITDRSSIDRSIKGLKRKYKRIDALVNSAYPRNRHYGRKYEDVTYKDFCENVSSHLGGYFLASQQFALFFRKQGYGNIINIASIYGVVPPDFAVYDGTAMTMPVEYAAIKAAVIHLTKYMARYFKGCNIRVNALSPGGIYDKQCRSFVKKYNKLCLSKGLLDAADINGALLYLLSDMSKYVNGQNIIIDDGWTL